MEVALQIGENAVLSSALTVQTPVFVDWVRDLALGAAAAVALFAGAALYLFARRRFRPLRSCAQCHRAFGGGNAGFQLLATLNLDEMGILGARPALGTFDIPDARVVMPGDPNRSMLVHRVALLLVQKGHDKGKRFPLAGKSVSVGSGPENAIRLADGAVSGRHAGLSIERGRVEIVDLGSRNGVLVNGRRTPRRVLEDGDVVTVGLTELKFETRTPAAAGPARW